MASALNATRISLELTHVVYEEGSILGASLAYITMLPLAIVVGYVTAMILRRDFSTVTMLLGQLVNEFLNNFLKKTIKQPRPDWIRSVKTDYGMPSSHSQFMFFFCVFIMFSLIMKKIHLEREAFQYIVHPFLGFLAVIVAFSRVYLGYHTVAQVLVGGIIGTAFALVWFVLSEFVFVPLFPLLAEFPLCKFFLFRDLRHIRTKQPMVKFEYEIIKKANNNNNNNKQKHHRHSNNNKTHVY